LSALTVSVVIPLYNKAAHIQRCLASVLSQTHRALEAVVVDDGSSDGGGQIVSSMGDDRIRLVRQSNEGVSVARNTGLAMATQDWVFFLDADDEWSPTLVESLTGLIQHCPDAGVLACPTERVYANGSSSSIRLDDKDFRGTSDYLQNYFATFVRLGQSPFSNSSFAVHRAAFRRAGGYTPGVRLTEDSDLWVRLALCTPIAMIRTALARYYVEAQGNTRSLPQREPFEVVRTLERVLQQGVVPVEEQSDARSLLRLQKLMQIRRHVLLGQRVPALLGLTEPDLWRGAAGACLVALIAALMPALGVETARNLKNIVRR
jgi:glycosyltransferase involved in cell wall biosynthesis